MEEILEFRKLTIEQLRNVDYDKLLKLTSLFNDHDIEKLSYADCDFIDDVYIGKSILLYAMKDNNVKLVQSIIQRSCSYKIILFLSNIFIWDFINSTEMVFTVLNLWEKYSISFIRNLICDCRKGPLLPTCDLCGPYNRAIRLRKWNIATGIVQFNIERLKKDTFSTPLAMDVVNDALYTPLEHLLSKYYVYLKEDVPECKELLKKLVEYELIRPRDVIQRYRTKYTGYGGVYIPKDAMFYSITKNAYPDQIDLVSLFLSLGIQITYHDLLCAIYFGYKGDFEKLLAFSNDTLLSSRNKEQLHYAAFKCKKKDIECMMQRMIGIYYRNSNIPLFDLVDLQLSLQAIKDSINRNAT